MVDAEALEQPKQGAAIDVLLLQPQDRQPFQEIGVARGEVHRIQIDNGERVSNDDNSSWGGE
jgi:hypothetical protein